MTSVATSNSHQSAWPTACFTSCQSSFRPNHHSNPTARRQSPPNSRYLRKDDFKLDLQSYSGGVIQLDFESTEPQDIGWPAKATTPYRSEQESLPLMLPGVCDRYC